MADKYTELVVNPNRVNKQIHRIDISDEFVKIVGHKFIRYRFSDEEHVSLFFDNDIKLVLSSKQLTGEEEVSGCLDIKSKFAPVKTSKQSYPFLLNRKY